MALFPSNQVRLGPLSGPGSNRRPPTDTDKSLTRAARERENEAKLFRLLRGEKLDERPFEKLSRAEKELVAFHADRFMEYRETRGELHF